MPVTLPFISEDECISKIRETPRPGEEKILAFYEHRLGGIMHSPRFMLLPLDDHLAHRGDGVFEALKYVDGRVYELDKHLARMQRSAEGIHLEPPCSWEDIRSFALQVAAAGREPTGLLRILLGRGPGGFGIAPSECPTASLYIVAHKFTPKPEEWYQKGLRGFRTTIPAKQGYLARIKNANYLPNVLMMYEAQERGLDVPFCFSEDGYLAESAVANICLVNHDGCIIVPQFSNSLPGTTVQRALELLDGKIPYTIAKVTEQDIFHAKEVFLLGTSPACVGIVSYENVPIGAGVPGSVAPILRKLIDDDVRQNGTPIPGLKA